MKIGQLAKKYNLTVNSIRFYTKIGLLVPVKLKNHYIFTNNCINDLRWIINLKNLGFTLNEILNFFNYCRLNPISSYNKIKLYSKLLISKQKKLKKEKERLENTLSLISSQLKNNTNTINKYKKPTKKIGLPLSFLSYLVCPHCNNTVLLKKASIVDNMIFDGHISCPNCCNFNCYIINGIINTHCEKNKVNYIKYPPIKKSSIKNSSRFIFNGMSYISFFLNENILENKIILDIGIGLTPLSNYLILKPKENIFYIVVRDSLEELIEYKKNIDSSKSNYIYIFICSNYDNIPIKNHMLDIIIDHYCSSIYYLKTSKLLVNELNSLINPNGIWISLLLYNIDNKVKHNKDINILEFNTISKFLTNFSGFSKEYLLDLGNTKLPYFLNNYFGNLKNIGQLFYCGKKI